MKNRPAEPDSGMVGPLVLSAGWDDPETGRCPLRIAGIALLACSIAAFLFILFPPKPANAEWEFAVMSRIADNALLPVLAIALITASRAAVLPAGSLFLVRVAALTLGGFGLLYLGLVPLAVRHTNSLRLVVDERIQAARNLNEIQGAGFVAAVEKAGSLEELEVLGMALGLTPDIAKRREALPHEGKEAFRAWLRSGVLTLQRRNLGDALAKFEADKAELLKEGVKISVILLFSGGAAMVMLFHLAPVFRKHVPCRDGRPV